jgi:hypothetical protein
MNRCLRELRAMKPARFASVEADLLKRPSRVAALSTVVAAAKRTGRGDRFPHDSLLPDGPCLHQLADPLISTAAALAGIAPMWRVCACHGPTHEGRTPPPAQRTPPSGCCSRCSRCCLSRVAPQSRPRWRRRRRRRGRGGRRQSSSRPPRCSTGRSMHHLPQRSSYGSRKT